MEGVLAKPSINKFLYKVNKPKSCDSGLVEHIGKEYCVQLSLYPQDIQVSADRISVILEVVLNKVGTGS